MPAKKPKLLNKRHNTNSESADREAAESAMTPKTELTLKPPASLNGHKIAVATWRRIVGLYFEVEGKIATAFDQNLLETYCILVEEVSRFMKRRDEVDDMCSVLIKQIGEFKKKKLTDEDREVLSKLLGQSSALLARVQGLDARLDGKRKLLHTLSQSLYLTPRARAGVEPPTKPPAEPQSEMEKLLNE